MIQIQNNYLPKNVFDRLQEYCYANEFKIATVGDKQYSTLEIPEGILDYFQIPGHEIVLSFLRDAWIDFDTELRAHADKVIAGRKTSFAAVLYVNHKEDVSKNGTAFWKHHIHNLEMPPETSDEEFDRMLTEDANDISKWEQTAYVENEPNRLVLYKSSLFHSKWPSVIENGRRIVLVIFYSQIINP